MKKSLLAGIVIAFTMAANAHAATNIAASLPSTSYTQSSTWSSGTNAQVGFNGGVWNSGNWGYQWIQVDLGSVRDIGSIEYTLNLAPNGNVNQKVFISNSSIGNSWSSQTAAASFSGLGTSGDVLTHNLNTSGRYVEIVAFGGESWTALSNVRVTAAVPEPETYAMLLGGLALLGAISRRKKTA